VGDFQAGVVRKKTLEAYREGALGGVYEREKFCRNTGYSKTNTWPIGGALFRTKMGSHESSLQPATPTASEKGRVTGTCSWSGEKKGKPGAMGLSCTTRLLFKSLSNGLLGRGGGGGGLLGPPPIERLILDRIFKHPPSGDPGVR